MVRVISELQARTASRFGTIRIQIVRKNYMPQVKQSASVGSNLWSSRRLELLNGMSQQTVQRFNEMVRTIKHRRGQWIFVHGDNAECIYLLQQGRLKLTTVTEDGHEVLHEIVGPGEVFGETSPILGLPRTTSAQALETSLVCEIREKDFETLLSIYPDLSFQLLKAVGLRLKHAEAQLVNVICNDVSHRVRKALIDLMDKESVTLPGQPIKIMITQQDLANSIGASREKTSRALKELEESSVLRLRYRSILVIAPEKLRTLNEDTEHGARCAFAKAKTTAL